MLDAILFALWTGCQWQALPRDSPKWSSVDTIYRRWKLEGVWNKVHDQLREKVRRTEGKASSASA